MAIIDLVHCRVVELAIPERSPKETNVMTRASRWRHRAAAECGRANQRERGGTVVGARRAVGLADPGPSFG